MQFNTFILYSYYYGFTWFGDTISYRRNGWTTEIWNDYFNGHTVDILRTVGDIWPSYSIVHARYAYFNSSHKTEIFRCFLKLSKSSRYISTILTWKKISILLGFLRPMDDFCFQISDVNVESQTKLLITATNSCHTAFKSTLVSDLFRIPNLLFTINKCNIGTKIPQLIWIRQFNIDMLLENILRDVVNQTKSGIILLYDGDEGKYSSWSFVPRLKTFDKIFKIASIISML